MRFATMRMLAILLLSVSWPAMAQEVPFAEYTWNEGDGITNIPAADIEHFGQTVGRYEVVWTPGAIGTADISQRILTIPNHLAVWVYNDGIHGAWRNDAGEERLFRTRWGLPAPGVTVKIVVTWDGAGYAVMVDGVLRIHDWQTAPTTVFPDPDAVAGTYGDPTVTGSFELSVWDEALTYDRCAVDVVGTINENIPLDNTGNWSAGIDPACTGEGPVWNGSTLTWTLPIQNEDGSDITDLAGVRLYQLVHDTFDPTVTSWTAPWEPPGTYTYVATAYNTQDEESVFSNEAVDQIGPLKVSDDKAYTVVQSEGTFIAFIIGTVPVGTECDDNTLVKGQFDFLPFTAYGVPLAAVTITGDIEPETVVATCH